MMTCERLREVMIGCIFLFSAVYFSLNETVLPLVLAGTASQMPAVDPNHVDRMQDTEIGQAIERLRPEYERLKAECVKAREKLESFRVPASPKDMSAFDLAEWERLGRDYEQKRRALMPIQSDLAMLQGELDRRASIPQEVKEYEQLKEYRKHKYNKGTGSRQEMADKFKDFAAKYPHSPLAIQALFDAGVLYTGGILRESGEEAYEPEKARELYGRIVREHPDLLDGFVIWSRHALATLHPSADERFKGCLEFYRWLRGIRPEQYAATTEWMRRDYRFRNAAESELRSRIDGLVKGTMETVQKNLVGDAKASSNPIENCKLLEQVLGVSATSTAEPSKNKGADVNDTAASTVPGELDDERNGDTLAFSWPVLALCIGSGVILVGAAMIFARRRRQHEGR